MCTPEEMTMGHYTLSGWVAVRTVMADVQQLTDQLDYVLMIEYNYKESSKIN